MSFFGLFGKEKKRVAPPQYIIKDDKESQQPQNVPWQQALQRSRQTRSKFWNNMSGLSWNRGKSKVAEARMRRRRVV